MTASAARRFCYFRSGTAGGGVLAAASKRQEKLRSLASGPASWLQQALAPSLRATSKALDTNRFEVPVGCRPANRNVPFDEAFDRDVDAVNSNRCEMDSISLAIVNSPAATWCRCSSKRFEKPGRVTPCQTVAAHVAVVESVRRDDLHDICASRSTTETKRVNVFQEAAA